jgi:hypothetical protein
MGFQKSTPSSAQLTIRVRYTTAPDFPGRFRLIDALAGPKSLNQDRKQYLEAISILTRAQERDSN